MGIFFAGGGPIGLSPRSNCRGPKLLPLPGGGVDGGAPWENRGGVEGLGVPDGFKGCCLGAPEKLGPGFGGCGG
ncbi:hypothetical protein ACFL0Z_02865 [Patescibacteria group bacterium]